MIHSHQKRILSNVETRCEYNHLFIESIRSSYIFGWIYFHFNSNRRKRKIVMLITIFTFVSITLALQSTAAACGKIYDRFSSADESSLFFSIDCSVCELDKVFNATRGYACFIASDNTPICTCPDQRFEVNKRCRRSNYLVSQTNDIPSHTFRYL